MQRLGTAFLTLCFAFCISLEAQVKLNELTKSNMSFKKSFNTGTYEGANKSYRDADKRFSTDTSSNSGKSYSDKDKRFSTNPYSNEDKRASGYGENYNSPTLREDMGTRSRFYDENKELFLDNKSRNLNRDYLGRSDFSKKSNMQGMVDKVYEGLMDRSMSDINKYHSQSSREDSIAGNIPISTVNSESETSSILDLLDFSKKKIENPSGSFSLPKSMSHMRTSPLEREVSKEDIRKSEKPSQYPSEAYQASQPKNSEQQRLDSPKNPNIPDYSNPNTNYTPRQTSNAQTANAQSQNKKTYTVEKPVKQDGYEESVFGVPKRFDAGKLKITVEVK